MPPMRQAETGRKTDTISQTIVPASCAITIPFYSKATIQARHICLRGRHDFKTQ